MKRILDKLRSLLSTTIPQLSRHKSLSLEEQLEELRRLGLPLNEGITLDDLLHSWERRVYENPPFDLLLFVMGSEVERAPWGRRVCDRVWNFDMECIEGTGSYVSIVQNLCRVAGKPELISELDDFVDLETQTAWLKYKIDGRQRHFQIVVDNDWADAETVNAIMRDIARDGKRFYSKDNGQASIWFYLDEATAAKLNSLSGNVLKPNVG